MTVSKINVLDLRKKKADNERIVMVTAYDYTMARLVDRAGVDMVLVGDSLGMVVQGHEDTLPVTMDHMVYHTRCVARGLQRAHLAADMPFMSFQINAENALISAGRLLKEGRAQSVKLEGGERSAAAISACVQAGIPVVGHVGLTPQSVNAMGGFRIQGRSEAQAEAVVRDALAVQEAGAFCLVLEGMPSDVAAEITQRLDIGFHHGRVHAPGVPRHKGGKPCTHGAAYEQGRFRLFHQLFCPLPAFGVIEVPRVPIFVAAGEIQRPPWGKTCFD